MLFSAPCSRCKRFLMKPAAPACNLPSPNFFNSIQQLSTNPSSTSLRAGVLTSAQNLAQNFQSTASSLVSIQRSADLSVSQSVSQINSLTTQIAQLNGEVSQCHADRAESRHLHRSARSADQSTLRPDRCFRDQRREQRPHPYHHWGRQSGGW